MVRGKTSQVRAIGKWLVIVAILLFIIIILGWFGFNKFSWDSRKIFIGFSIFLALVGTAIYFLSTD